MPEPIVFISQFRIHEGKRDALRDLTEALTADLERQKPRTVLFLVYMDDDANAVSFLHAFADQASMDAHFEGADERSNRAYEFMVPLGWEVYGRPSEAALLSLRQAAESAGVDLVVHADFVAGFLRLNAAGGVEH
jgi:quinol monooxygenase YgiN